MNVGAVNAAALFTRVSPPVVPIVVCPLRRRMSAVPPGAAPALGEPARKTNIRSWECATQYWMAIIESGGGLVAIWQRLRENIFRSLLANILTPTLLKGTAVQNSPRTPAGKCHKVFRPGGANGE